MLKLDHFWEEEAGAPLLMHDKGFIREMGDEIWEVTAKWPGLAGVEEPVPELPPYDEEKVSRIVLRDAERTFFGDKQRQRCCHVLSILENHYGDYGQGLGYAAGFLMLFFEPEVVVAICRNLADNEKYIPGYWGLEAVPPVVDAHVFGAFAGNFFPEVAGHLEAKTVAAKTYTQKWFVGLCVHVLHFKPLFQFWEAFLTEGYPFLFKFALAHFTEAGPMLLAAESHVDLFGILRLDPEFTDDDLRERIATTAVAMDVGDPQEFIGAIQGLRVEMFENVVKPRMEATAKYNEEHASDDEVDWDAEGDECQVCEGFPEVYWAAHDIILCNGCVDKGVEEGDILGHPFDKESAGLISHAAYERDVKGKDGGDDDDDGGDGDGDAVDAAVDALADDVAQIQIAAEDGGN